MKKVFKSGEILKNIEKVKRKDERKILKIIKCPIRQYGMNQRQDAPVDSNHYFKVE